MGDGGADTSPRLDVELLEGRAGADPALEVALQESLLGMVAAGTHPPVVRCYRPLATVAFGRRDAFLPGFSGAAATAREHGFDPVIRAAGGRAAAYDEGCLVLDEIMAEPDAMRSVHERFAGEAQRQARALRSLGVDARVGQVPGEYCPGEFSVNARGRTKLAGAAQRIVSGGWLFSTVLVVSSAPTVRAVLEDVYGELGLEWDPATTGSVADEVPRASVEDVRRSLLADYARRYHLVPGSLGARELARAEELLDRHRVEVRAR